MSSEINSKNNHSIKHGSIRPYVIGFILSLILTLIPYYLVVNESFNSTTLLRVIFGIALVQMLVQVLFFLHLGRGPKPNWSQFFFLTTAFISAVVVGGSIFIISNLHYNMSPDEQIKKIVNDEGIYQVGGIETGACKRINVSHVIKIKNGAADPSYVLAAQCDTISFISDDRDRVINFGEANNPQPYAGERNLSISSSRSETITLSEKGTFTFYDETDPNVKGGFTVY